MSVTALWVAGGVLCALVELATPFMVLIFFAFGAWAAAVAAGFGYGLDWQLGTFIAVSILSLAVLRKHAKAFFSGRARSGNDEGAHPMMDRSGVVSKIITPFEPGEVNIGGSFWRATAGRPVDVGEQVRVLSALPDDALMLYVEPLRPEKNV
ncbi:MAG: NfeD family protein [Desulfovibrionaceae bacterium]|nr:NfeD family protein [Desulfovibrionaceae bacterium]